MGSCPVLPWPVSLSYFKYPLLDVPESNYNRSYKKWGVKYHFVTLNSVLALLNSVFALILGVRMGCHFNNSMFIIKKI